MIAGEREKSLPSDFLQNHLIYFVNRLHNRRFINKLGKNREREKEQERQSILRYDFLLRLRSIQ